MMIVIVFLNDMLFCFAAVVVTQRRHPWREGGPVVDQAEVAEPGVARGAVDEDVGGGECAVEARGGRAVEPVHAEGDVAGQPDAGDKRQGGPAEGEEVGEVGVHALGDDGELVGAEDRAAHAEEEVGVHVGGQH